MSKYAGPWKVYVRQNSKHYWSWRVSYQGSPRSIYIEDLDVTNRSEPIAVEKDRGGAFSRKGALRRAKHSIQAMKEFPDEWKEVNMREVLDA